MADTKISALTALTTPDSLDLLPIVDVSATETKRITLGTLFANLGAASGQTLSLTSTVAQVLSVIRSGTGQTQLVVGNGEGSFILVVDGGEFSLYDLTNALYRMRVLANGNVGIGAGTTPQGKLTVEDGLIVLDSGNFTPSKFDTQGAAWSTRPTATSIIFNDDASIRPEISWYRGTNTYPQFAIRMSTNSNEGGSIWAGSGAGAPTEVVTIKNDGRIGIGAPTPNANAILDVASTTKAFMPPRMTTTQRDAIPSPTEGMVIYNSTTKVLNFHNGTAWGAV